MFKWLKKIFGSKSSGTADWDKMVALAKAASDLTEVVQNKTTADKPNVNTIRYEWVIPDGLSYFKDSEFISANDPEKDKLTGKMNPELIRMLNVARYIDGKPWKVNSGIRSAAHNKTVGGVAGSAHTKGLAVDISATTGVRKFEIINAAIAAGFTRIGVNKNFIHLDIDESKPSPSLFLY